jgi:LCP family protein required for cell wall assembly
MNVYSGSGTPPEKPKRRRPTWRRVLYWSLASLLVLIAAVVGGGAWWLYSQYTTITHVDKSVGRARSVIGTTIKNVPLAEQPVTALIIGSDHRYTDGSSPPRSDTLMLVHIDPKHKLVSVLSLPRDLWVDIPGLGMDKINAAFSQGANGAKLAVETVYSVTHVRPQYLAVVNFRGFQNLVNDIGGVFIPVDENYQHSNAGQYGANVYSEISIDPGYQRLNGKNALAFARFRHTDSDFYRNARQQIFLKQFELAAANRFHGISVTDLPSIMSTIHDVAANVEITGRHAPSIGTLREYAALLYSMHGKIVSVRLKQEQSADIGGASVVIDPPSDMKAAVYAFLHPWKIPQPGDKLPKQRRPHSKKFKPAMKPERVRVAVLNGTDRTGLAAKVSGGLGDWGYPAAGANAPAANYVRTWVYYKPGFARAAHDVAKIVGRGFVEAVPARFAHRSHARGDVVLILGTDYAGKLALRAPKAKPFKLPPDMVATQDYRADFLNAARAAHLPALYPSAVPSSSSFRPFSYSQPIRVYGIGAAGSGNNSFYAYWQNNLIAGSYWGIQATKFVNAPILSNPSAVRRLDGRKYLFYFNGAHISMIAQIDRVHGVVYWVQNTLLNELSNADMIAIARSLRPAG